MSERARCSKQVYEKTYNDMSGNRCTRYAVPSFGNEPVLCEQHRKAWLRQDSRLLHRFKEEET